ncbi:MAG: phage shock protein [Sphingomonadales bacterium]|jgi:phage shock protein PspC (stress-responsive transcriptional regulator)|nr:phage shock protein [Sphingomonadales bacterium]MEA3050225.1 phage shock protein [Sphingomonadales bacterium]
MQDETTNLLLRDDTMLGVCQGLGEDFGFNPIWLRIAFGATLLINPIAVVGTYLGLGVLVATSRLVFPRPRPAAGGCEVSTPGQALAQNEDELLPVAA